VGLAGNLERQDNPSFASKPLEAGLENQQRAYRNLEAQQQAAFPNDNSFVLRSAQTL
jgi:hypothetical protein